MNEEEKLFKEMLVESDTLLEANTFPRGISYGVIGRMNAQNEHKAQLFVKYCGVVILTIDYPIRGYSKEVDIVNEIKQAETHLFRRGLIIAGGVGLMSLAVGSMAGRPPLRRLIPVNYPDNDRRVPFSDN